MHYYSAFLSDYALPLCDLWQCRKFTASGFADSLRIHHLFGLLAGLAGGRWMVRVVPERERAAVERLLSRWGVGLIIVTRPLPLFAESVAVMAGASKMAAWKVLLAGFVGSLPAAVFYAIAGAQAQDAVSSTVVVAVVFVVAAGLCWFAKGTEVSPTSE